MAPKETKLIPDEVQQIVKDWLIGWTEGLGEKLDLGDLLNVGTQCFKAGQEAGRCEAIGDWDTQ